MRFFRSRWLQRILLFLLPVLLSAGTVGLIEQERDGKGDYVISSPYCFGKLNGQLQQPKIKYGFDVIQVSVVPVFKKIISEEYIPGTSFDPLSIDILTQLSRAPPRLIAIL